MSKNSIKAFTLIELLVVIAIVGILAGIIIMSMASAVNQATFAKAKVFSSSMRDSMSSSIVSEWKFDGNGITDGGSATTDYTKDTWGTNNGTSTYFPTVRTGSSCVFGSCLQFDGSNDYIDFGSDSSLSMGAKDATVSLWVKFDNQLALDNETLIKCGAGGSGLDDDGYWIHRRTETNMIYGNFTDGTNQRFGKYLSDAKSLITDTWNNVVIVFDRDSSMYIYINGIKQSNSINISAQQGSITNSKSMGIGAWAYNNSRLSGKIDEVRIYNSVLPSAQIKQQYYSGLKNLLANKGITQQEYDQRLANLDNYCLAIK